MEVGAGVVGCGGGGGAAIILTAAKPTKANNMHKHNFFTKNPLPSIFSSSFLLIFNCLKTALLCSKARHMPIAGLNLVKNKTDVSCSFTVCYEQNGIGLNSPFFAVRVQNVRSSDDNLRNLAIISRYS